MGNTQTNENNSEIENKLLDETAEKTLKYIEKNELKKRGRDVYNSLDEAFIEKKNAENFLRNEIEGEARLNQQIEMNKRSEGVKGLKNNYKKVSDAIENAAKPEQKYIETSKNKRQRISDGKKRKSKTKSTRKNKKKN
jgi:hypothetical protein